ncbi:aminotransferase class IV family protein [Ruegeria sp. HKCCD7255]|uniref:aminotransferase class IV family protein n=1 Tax=Ruegeria sp. HKCCD7255 TaxID=2683004 RepID=UPI0014879EF6|nr:aminotransferase class IV family protein [Ruegeria sp. HKCCD7255]
MESPLRVPTEPDFRLIETFAFRPRQGVIRGDMHLARMARTTQVLSLPFDLDAAQAMLDRIAGEAPLRCRLTMDVSGHFELTTAALADTASKWRLALTQTRLQSADPWLRHKTTRRSLYDKERATLPKGIDEVLFLNERGELCEGTITNLFLEMPNGTRLTPSLSSGVLPGILREELLENDEWAEAVLTLTDLKQARAVFMGNALRGLIPVEMVNL